MTLVELMIVVVILGVLAALSFVGYRRFVGRARSSEAAVMLAEMAAKEQLYFLEFAHYLPLRTDNLAPAVSGGTINEPAAAFFPRVPGAAGFESVRSAQTVGTMPNSWRFGGIRPKESALYCAYMANAGRVNSAPDTSGHGDSILGTAAILQHWFYAVAACNLSGSTGYPLGDSIWAISSRDARMLHMNDGQ